MLSFHFDTLLSLREIFQWHVTSLSRKLFFFFLIINDVNVIMYFSKCEKKKIRDTSMRMRKLMTELVKRYLVHIYTYYININIYIYIYSLL